MGLCHEDIAVLGQFRVEDHFKISTFTQTHYAPVDLQRRSQTHFVR